LASGLFSVWLIALHFSRIVDQGETRLHPSLFRQAVTLFIVTWLASQDKVVPGVGAASTSWHDVIDYNRSIRSSAVGTHSPTLAVWPYLTVGFYQSISNVRC
jgi:hypothetical protein